MRGSGAPSSTSYQSLDAVLHPVRGRRGADRDHAKPSAGPSAGPSRDVGATIKRSEAADSQRLVPLVRLLARQAAAEATRQDTDDGTVAKTGPTP